MHRQRTVRESGRQRALPHLASRISLVFLGSFTALYGLTMMHGGVMVYQNGSYRATTYSAATLASGIFIAILGLLPTSLVSWLAGTKASSHREQTSPHRRHHEPK